MSATCSCHQPNTATTTTTQTAAAPTATAGPTPTQKHLDKSFFILFLFFSSHLDLTGQWQPYHCHYPHLPHPHAGHPHLPATTSLLNLQPTHCHCNDLITTPTVATSATTTSTIATPTTTTTPTMAA